MRHQLKLEILESRILCAVDIDFDETLSELTITGDEGVNNFTSIHFTAAAKIAIDHNGVEIATDFDWPEQFNRIYIHGRGGNDTIDIQDFPSPVISFEIDGGDGDDILKSPAADPAGWDFGEILIFGNNGSDHIYGGENTETLVGDEGYDPFNAPADPGSDTIYGYGGIDYIRGNEGEDTIDGGSGADDIKGGSDRDIIQGGPNLTGVDVIRGEGGNDEIHGGDGIDNLYGDDGNDTLYADNGVAGTWEILEGGIGNDILHGSSFGEEISGGPGQDELHAEGAEPGSGNDDTGMVSELYGGADYDQYFGSFGPDFMQDVPEDVSPNTFQSSDGNDEVRGGGGIDTIWGGEDDDKIFGLGGDDILMGEGGVDTIYGGADDDSINAGADDDTTWSNTGGGDIDQPYDGNPPNVGWNDMKGSGGPGCDIEDGVIECLPKAVPDARGVKKNVMLVEPAPGLLANDDPDGDCDGSCNCAITDFALVQSPSNGSLTLDVDPLTGLENGGFTYTPATGFTGIDTFTYTITNEHGTSEAASVTLNITNTPPTAGNDTLTTDFGYGGSVGISKALLLANDNDENGDELTPEVYSNPSNGYVVANGDGSFSYYPYSATVTADSFQYRAFDGESYSDPATVTLNLNNPAITTANDSFPGGSRNTRSSCWHRLAA